MPLSKPSSITSQTGAYQYKGGATSTAQNYIDNQFPNLAIVNGPNIFAGNNTFTGVNNFNAAVNFNGNVGAAGTVTIVNGFSPSSAKLHLGSGATLEMLSGSIFTIDSGVTVTIGSASTFSALATFNAGATVASGNLGVTSGNVTVGAGNVTITTGNLTLSNASSTATFNGNLTVNEVATFNANTFVGGTFTTLASSNFNGNVTINDSTAINANTFITGTLAVTGAITATTTISATGNMSCNSISTVNNVVLGGGGQIEIDNPSLITFNVTQQKFRAVPFITIYPMDTSVWTANYGSELQTNAGTGNGTPLYCALPTDYSGATLSTISVVYQIPFPTSRSPAANITFSLVSNNMTTGAQTTIATASVTNYNVSGLQLLTLTPNITLDTANNIYSIKLTDESGTGAVGGNLYFGMKLHYSNITNLLSYL